MKVLHVCADMFYVMLLVVTSLLMSLLTPVTSQCAPQAPCRSCEYVTVERDDKDCNKYYYCYFGRPWSNMRCGHNQIYSTEAKACVYKYTTNECSTSIVETVTLPPLTYTTSRTTRYIPKYPSPQTTVSYPKYQPPQTTPYYPIYQPIPTTPYYPKYPPPETTPTSYYPVYQHGQTTSKYPLYQPAQSETVSSAKPSIDDSQFSASCGIKSSNWIVGGEEALPGEWAWQVSLQVYHRYSRQFVHFCGGTLVHESWVVTAAHCVHGYTSSYLIAVIGAFSLRSSQPDEQKRQISKILINPGYRHFGNYPHDIALLQLSTPVKMSRSVGVACLPSQGEDPVAKHKQKYATTGCWVTGWGLTLGTAKIHTLNELKIELVEQDYCTKKWPGFVQNFHLCAGEGDTGACRGDSGGPLVCTSKGRFYLEGVVSWGEDTCLLKGYPNVFTRVSSYADWIRETINTLSSR